MGILVELIARKAQAVGSAADGETKGETDWKKKKKNSDKGAREIILPRNCLRLPDVCTINNL